MPAIFSKNCIVTGDLDSYCLVCSAHLPGDVDVLEHIRGPKHNANMKPMTYFDKYKDDFIRKVKGVYFCEVCNMTFPTAAKVGMHVTEETHLEGKRRQLKRVGTSIVFQNNVLIEDSAWNGLVEDTCVLCNADYDDYSNHKSESTHILNVVKGTVIIDDNNNIYRKVDGGFHCLTCNKVISDKVITEHLDSEQHRSAFIKYDQNQNDVNAKNGHQNPVADETKEATKEKTAGNEDVINEVSGNSAGTKTVKDEQSPTTDLQVSAILNCVKEHVAGKKNNLFEYKKRNSNKIEKIQITKFITDVAQIVNLDKETYVIINDKFCMKSKAFLGYAMMNHKIICQFCHIDLTPEDAMEHLRSTSHRHSMENSFVFTSLENEFVRQIKSDMYYCSFCARVKNKYDDMLDHLATVEHQLKKFENQRLLETARFKFSIRSTMHFFTFLEFLGRMRHF